MAAKDSRRSDTWGVWGSVGLHAAIILMLAWASMPGRHREEPISLEVSWMAELSDPGPLQVDDASQAGGHEADLTLPLESLEKLAEPSPQAISLPAALLGSAASKDGAGSKDAGGGDGDGSGGGEGTGTGDDSLGEWTSGAGLAGFWRLTSFDEHRPNEVWWFLGKRHVRLHGTTGEALGGTQVHG